MFRGLTIRTTEMVSSIYNIYYTWVYWKIKLPRQKLFNPPLFVGYGGNKFVLKEGKVNLLLIFGTQELATC